MLVLENAIDFWPYSEQSSLLSTQPLKRQCLRWWMRFLYSKAQWSPAYRNLGCVVFGGIGFRAFFTAFRSEHDDNFFPFIVV